MTPDRHPLAARLLRWALALYPASYGAGALTEVADHAERHIARAGRLAGLREVADVAGHGARTRLGLVSHRPLGRAFATAAPLAAVLAGTFAATHLWWAGRLVTDPDFQTFSVDGAEKAGPLVAAASLCVPATLMAGAVLADRWSAARALALATIVVAPLLDVLSRPGLLGLSVDIGNTFGLVRQESGLLVLNALILLIAPPGRTRQRSAVPWAVAVPITVAVVITTLTDGFGQRTFLSGFDIVAPVATGAAVAFTARTPGRATLATAVLAAPPLLVPALAHKRMEIPIPMMERLVVLYSVGYLIALCTVLLTARFTDRPTERRSRPTDLTRP